MTEVAYCIFEITQVSLCITVRVGQVLPTLWRPNILTGIVKPEIPMWAPAYRASRSETAL